MTMPRIPPEKSIQNHSSPMRVVILWLGLWTLLASPGAIQAAATPSAPPAFKGMRPQMSQLLGHLPLAFEANQGQTDSEVKFITRGPGGILFLTPNEAVLAIKSGVPISSRAGGTQPPPPGDDQAPETPETVVRWHFVGANPAPDVRGIQELPGKVNYFRGQDQTQWHTNVPTYARVRYRDLYPGVDLVYHGDRKQLEYDLVLAPGADPKAIKLAIEGAGRMTLTRQGDLRLRTPGADLRFKKPSVYQEEDGRRREISGRYVLLSGGQVGFHIGSYDHSRPLVIDPLLVFSSYLGGSGSGTSGDTGFGIAADSNGFAYVTGETNSADFPVKVAFQPVKRANTDVFVTKIDTDLGYQVFSTFIGSAGYDQGRGITVDKAGYIYVTGHGGTMNPDFPTTPGSYQQRGTGGFITKISPTGASLVYSTMLKNTKCYGIATDGAGNAYVTGEANSLFTTTANGAQPVFGGGATDAFVAKLNPTGSGLVYATFLGGSGTEAGFGIAVDLAGNAYIAGHTSNGNLPVTPGAPQTTYGGGSYDAFAAKIRADGGAIDYCTYLGGTGSDEAWAIAVDALGQAHVTGQTMSAGFPTYLALKSYLSGSMDGFVTKLNAAGTGFIYSTYLGGSGSEAGRGIVVDAAGQAHVTGDTGSKSDFPLLNPYQTTSKTTGRSTAFVTRLTPAGALAFSTYLGGSTSDLGYAIAVDAAGSSYVTGSTFSFDFPTMRPFQATRKAISQYATNTFVAKFADVLGPGLKIQPQAGGNTGWVTVIIRGSGLLPGSGIRLERAGYSPIPSSTNTVFSNDHTKAVARFKLTGQSPGNWDVVVASLNGQILRIPGGFKIEEGGKPLIWCAIVGRSIVRMGVDQTYTISFGNSGNVDAELVPIWIGGIPSDGSTTFGIDTPLTPPPDIPGIDPANWDDVSIAAESNGEYIIPLIAPLLPPGYTGTVQLRLNHNSMQDFELRSWATEPYFSGGSDWSDPPAPENYPPIADCAGKVLEILIKEAVGVMLPVDCANKINKFMFDSGFDLGNKFLNVLAGKGESQGEVVSSGISLWASAMSAALACAGDLTPWGKVFKVSASIISVWNKGLGLIDKCAGAFKAISDFFLKISMVLSWDPNEIDGPMGVGASRWVSGALPLPYAISFENLKTATAPAQQVVITNRLNRTQMDLDTFSLGTISFGKTTITPVPGLKEFVTQVDLRPAKPLLVTVEANQDPVSGVATWRLTAVDPATGLPPEDPLLGFLPANVTPPEGEGKVLYTVMPAAHLTTGERVRNQATIIFDKNPPMTTPVWFNTMDSRAPVSRVLPLDITQTSAAFLVEWSGDDAGAGVKDYSIYVSEDGQPFIAWLTNVPETSGTFNGLSGKNYAFYSIARDLTGNVEKNKYVAEASTSTPAASSAAGSLNSSPVLPRSPKSYTAATPSAGSPGHQVSIKERGSAMVSEHNPEDSTLPKIASVDRSKPISWVLSLEPIQKSTVFPVKWTGKNGGAGIRDYTIFVSENEGPYTVWLADTTATSATFRGGLGKRYAFYSVARDRWGNVQGDRLEPDAVTFTPAD